MCADGASDTPRPRTLPCASIGLSPLLDVAVGAPTPPERQVLSWNTRRDFATAGSRKRWPLPRHARAAPGTVLPIVEVHASIDGGPRRSVDDGPDRPGRLARAAAARVLLAPALAIRLSTTATPDDALRAG